MATIDDFLTLDIRAGRILSADVHAKAKAASYLLRIDFGEGIGVKGSSAQLSENYEISDLVGSEIIGIVNLPPRRVAGFKSEVLVLALVCPDEGTILVRPDRPVSVGARLA